MPLRSKFKSRNDAIEEEAKKLKEDEETALVYKQFVETFEESTPVNKMWVKGGTTFPGSSGVVNSGTGGLYQPYQKKTESMEKIKQKLLPETLEKPGLMKPKRKSNLEAFSEELKQIQRERELRASKPRDSDHKYHDEPRRHKVEPVLPPIVSQPLLPTPMPYDLDYPFDGENDKTTTNLFLGNLSPELSEQHLCELFGRFGPLASVKIMWPRNDDEKARGRNCGFVAYMNRNDGERALDRLRGVEICGVEMRLGWAKTVIIPPYPIYVPPRLVDRIKPPPQSGLPFNAQPNEWLEKMEHGISFERTQYDMFSMTNEQLHSILKDCVVKISIPTDCNLLHLINRTIEFVVREGVEFEAYIMNKEMRNPIFKFLFDFQSPEHTYYRWKLYSILHGDTAKSWKTDAFRMFKDGPLWKPPPMNPFSSGMPEDLIDDVDVSNITIETLNKLLETNVEKQDHIEYCPLETSPSNIIARNIFTQDNVDQLDIILTELNPGKFSIGEAMVWCLERSDYAEDILKQIIHFMEKVINPKPEFHKNPMETDVSEQKPTLPSKKQSLNHAVALLFLLSDLLHNSSAKVKNASFYRKHIEVILPQVMELYNQFFQSFHSKVKSELFKSKVLTCFRAWGDWYVYPFEYLWKLQNQFLGFKEPNITESVSNDNRAEDSSNNNSNDNAHTKSLVDYDGDPLDIDGLPLDCDNTTGSSKMNNNKTKEDKIDMFDMFGDNNNAYSPDNKNNGSSSKFITSKWETVDPTDDDTETVKSRWQLMEEEEANNTKQDVDVNKSDNSDSDGYPLSDDGYDLGSGENCQMNTDISKNSNKLVSYGGGSSDNDSDDEENDNRSVDDGIPLPKLSSHTKINKRSYSSRHSEDKSNSKELENHKRKKTSNSRGEYDKHPTSSRSSSKKSRDVDPERERRSVRPMKEIRGRKMEKDRSDSRDRSSRTRRRTRSRSLSSRNSHRRKLSKRR